MSYWSGAEPPATEVAANTMGSAASGTTHGSEANSQGSATGGAQSSAPATDAQGAHGQGSGGQGSAGQTAAVPSGPAEDAPEHTQATPTPEQPVGPQDHPGESGTGSTANSGPKPTVDSNPPGEANVPGDANPSGDTNPPGDATATNDDHPSNTGTSTAGEETSPEETPNESPTASGRRPIDRPALPDGDSGHGTGTPGNQGRGDPTESEQPSAAEGGTEEPEVQTGTRAGSGEEETSPAEEGPSLPAGMRKIRFTNHPESKGKIQFLVNGKLKTLEPGEAIELTGKGIWQVRFHRGGSYGDATHDLVPGKYEFKITARGWTLKEASVKKPRPR